jgi:hypothetical protein
MSLVWSPNSNPDINIPDKQKLEIHQSCQVGNEFANKPTDSVKSAIMFGGRNLATSMVGLLCHSITKGCVCLIMRDIKPLRGVMMMTNCIVKCLACIFYMTLTIIILSNYFFIFFTQKLGKFWIFFNSVKSTKISNCLEKLDKYSISQKWKKKNFSYLNHKWTTRSRL